MEIKFKIPNTYDNFIKKIFDNINFKDAEVLIEDDEVFLKNGELLFNKNNYKYEELLKFINKKTYYIVFLNMSIVFFDSKKLIQSNINLHIIDSEYVELKCDHTEIINKIIYNLNKNGFVISE